MSQPEPKRFFKHAAARAADDGFTIFLDTHQLKTPARAAFLVPTMALADAIADEWNAQGAKIAPRTMLLTSLANAVIDRIAPDAQGFAKRLAAYGKNDLLCYRVAEPVELAARMAKQWQPVLDWLAATHEAQLTLAEGVVHVDQPPEALGALESAVLALDPFRLGALHVLTTAMGSLGLGLAVLGGFRTVDVAFDLSRLDEEFQIERWGRDAEADARTDAIRREAVSAARFLDLVGAATV